MKKFSKKEVNRVAKILTDVFSPGTAIVAFSIMIYDKYVPSGLLNFVIWAGVTVLFIVIATIFIYVLYKQKKISDLNITKREERPQFFFPMLAIMITLTILNYSFGWRDSSSCLAFITVAYSVAFFTTLFFKISIHMFSITLVYLLALMIYGNFWAAMLWPIPLITGWTRIRLKKHSYQEVLAGFLVPFVLVILWIILKVDVTKLS